ncbi:hypothetical protein QO179_23975 [Bacillus stercoris]|nr:hypothetical protein [Bacillus stercoris]
MLPDDVFFLQEGGEIYSDEEYEVNYEDEQGQRQKETIRVRLGMLPDFGTEGTEIVVLIRKLKVSMLCETTEKSQMVKLLVSMLDIHLITDFVVRFISLLL